MRRRKSKTALTLVMALIVVVLICVICAKYLFVVRNVRIEGDVPMSEEDLIRAGDIDFGGSMFTLRLDDVRKQIERLGTVAVDDIEKQYPDTLIISVRTRKHEGMLMHAGQLLVLDDEGVVIESLSNAPAESLLYVSGMEVSGFTVGEVVYADEQSIAGYSAVVKALDENVADSYVSELNLQSTKNMKLISRSGITVQLGDKGNMINKIAWMKSAVGDLESRGQNEGVLDVASGTKADFTPAQLAAAES